MTPLGHAGWALLAAEIMSAVNPSLKTHLVYTAFVSGGILLDLDILYHSFKVKNFNILNNNLGEHRNLHTHTLLFAVTLFIVGIFLGLVLGNQQFIIFSFFFSIGAIMHLLIDTLFFPEGVNLFYPVSRKFYKFFYINKPNFFAPRPISNHKHWHINYLSSPLFWVAEVAPTFSAIVLLLQK